MPVFILASLADLDLACLTDLSDLDCLPDLLMEVGWSVGAGKGASVGDPVGGVELGAALGADDGLAT